MLQRLRRTIYNGLRKSEKITQTDMVYLASGSFWLTLSKAIASSASLILAILFANFLAKDEYGLYKYILSIASILSIATLAGLDTTVTTAVARGHDGSIMQIFKTKLKWGVVGGVIGLGIAGYYGWRGNDTLAIGIALAALCTPCMDAFYVYHAVLMGKQQFKLNNRYTIISRTITTIAIAIAIIISKTVVPILITYFLSWIIIRFFLWKKVINQCNLAGSIDQTAIGYGKHLSFLKSISAGVGNINNIALFQLVGSQALAAYSLAIAPIEQIRTAIRALENIILPKISHPDWRIPSVQWLLRKMIIFVGTLTILASTYAFIAPNLFAVLFPQYTEAVALSQLYAITIPLTGIVIVQNTIIRAKQKIQHLYILNSLNIALTIIVVLPLTYMLGVRGLIYGMISLKAIEVCAMSVILARQDFFQPKQQMQQ